MRQCCSSRLSSSITCPERVSRRVGLDVGVVLFLITKPAVHYKGGKGVKNEREVLSRLIIPTSCRDNRGGHLPADPRHPCRTRQGCRLHGRHRIVTTMHGRFTTLQSSKTVDAPPRGNSRIPSTSKILLFC